MGVQKMTIRERLEGFGKKINDISAQVGKRVLDTIDSGFDAASNFVDRSKAHMRVAALAGTIGTTALSCVEAPEAYNSADTNNTISVSAQGAETVEKNEEIKLMEFTFNEVHLYAAFDLKEREQAPVDVHYFNEDGEIFNTEQWLIDRENLGFENREASREASSVKIVVLNDDMTEEVQSYEISKSKASRPVLPE